jgi:hypothetical protein
MFNDFPRLSAGKQRMRGLWMLDYNRIEQPNENPCIPCLQPKAAILRRIALTYPDSSFRPGVNVFLSGPCLRRAAEASSADVTDIGQ